MRGNVTDSEWTGLLMRNWSRRRYLALLLAASMLLPFGAATPASAAAYTFTGGATDQVLYVPNDHTPIGFRFKADAGLSPSSAYYLKVRFTVGTSPSPSTNRGMTWNSTTGAWVPDLGGANWADYPVVTTASDGTLPEQWVFAKFADPSKSGSYYVMISLQNVVTGDVYNAGTLPTTTVLNMATNGAWVHNGTAVASNLGNKRVECTAASDETSVFSLAKSEMDAIDSDADGIVDNEDHGPAGKAGDFRLAVPVNTDFKVLLSRTTTYIATHRIAVPDTDIALNAADQEAPTAPASLVVTPGNESNALAWGASTDTGGSGIAQYRIYRWQASPSSAYTMPRAVIATVGPDVTSYVDKGLVVGSQYFYEVRAVDASTNVGPRSVTASGIPVWVSELTTTYGADRYATALALSEANFAASSVTTAVVATGKNFPDAMSAAGLAGVYGSPILLVRDSVTASLTAELDRLGVEDVVIIGSDKAVSADIESALDTDYDVTRVYGSDRYATSAAVATRIAALTTGLTDTYIARGDDFADALAASPFAYGRKVPVLLVKTDSVPTVIEDAIDALDLTDGIIVGSSAAVSNPVQAALDAMMSGDVTRIGGSDRYVTARMIADDAVVNGWGDYSYVGVATGLNFPDALGGGPVVAQHGGVMLLTRPTGLSTPVSEAITANKSTIETVEVYGSTAAVSQTVRDSISALLN